MKNLLRFPILLASFFCISEPVWAAEATIIPPMVTIKAGDFLMGSTAGPDGDGGMEPLETPVHKVAIKSFQLSKYEVTVRQFRQFVEATGHTVGTQCWRLAGNDWGIEMAAGSWNTPAYAPSDFHPVMCVSWDDAQAYVQWLTKQTGTKYRLPSEAEWEYAGRAGSTGKYHFGDDATQLCRYSNVYDHAGKAAKLRDFGKDVKSIDCDDQAEATSIVGMYQPNAFGLYDMTGNVGELVQDCQHTSYAGAPNDGSAWTTNCYKLGGGTMMIHRGGSYNNGPKGARISARGHAGQDNYSSLGEGFRLAMDITTEAAACSANPATASTCNKLSKENTFETELAIAQKTERTRRNKLMAENKGK
ncbi:formylglycine-generating enzyme family protein [Undibacterium sp. Ren11W]|uniref:formylglycine-generating enzyme family protein n=1 Tax=Undibacterium sp. Ren11W TaxID=3413045 RepID=UPI003BF2DD49